MATLPDVETTAVEIAEAVRSGSLTARAATERALAHIERTQPATNAWQVVRAEKALAEADAIDQRPDRDHLQLAGVPIAVKDNVPVAGEPMRDGSTASDPTPRTTDHEVVRRLREAGAVVVGTTRVPELCIWGATDSAFGITRNPWDPSLTPGGSSGGSAAAVAAGDVTLALGADGMGSIRIPSACCGLVGLKPGLGVVPADLGSTSWHGMAENGPLATTVADTAAMFAVLAGDASYSEVSEPEPLRIAWSAKSPAVGFPAAEEWANAARSTADLLAEAGHSVVHRSPTYRATLPATALQVWTAGAAQDAGTYADPSALERRNQRHVQIGRIVQRRGLPTGAREGWRQRAEAFFADIDVLITPTLARTPIAAKAWSDKGWLASIVANARFAPFANPWNLTGWPAMSVPAGVDAAGRPLGVQLVGRPGSERILLGLARQIEQRRPWQRTASL